MCSTVLPVPRIIESPSSEGLKLCRAAIDRYFYNPESAACEQFMEVVEEMETTLKLWSSAMHDVKVSTTIIEPPKACTLLPCC